MFNNLIRLTVLLVVGHEHFEEQIEGLELRHAGRGEVRVGDRHVVAELVIRAVRDRINAQLLITCGHLKIK